MRILLGRRGHRSRSPVCGKIHPIHGCDLRPIRRRFVLCRREGNVLPEARRLGGQVPALRFDPLQWKFPFGGSPGTRCRLSLPIVTWTKPASRAARTCAGSRRSSPMDYTELIRKADVALNARKRSDRQQICFYDPEQDRVGATKTAHALSASKRTVRRENRRG